MSEVTLGATMARRARLWVIGLLVAVLTVPSGLAAQGLASSASAHPSGSGSVPLPVAGGRVAASDGPIAGDQPAAAPLSPTRPLGPAAQAPCVSPPAVARSTPSAAWAGGSTAGSVPGAFPLVSSASPSTPSGIRAIPVPGTDPAVAAVLKDAEAAGACANTLFPPRAPASPAELAASRATGVVQPLYQGTPAPIGLADYGLSAGPNGSLVGSILDTTRLVGTVDANATGIQPLDLYNEELGPDGYTLQLNAVLTNVTLFGTPGFQFWTQNVFEFYPSARVMYLVTNVWNFSGNFLFGPAIYQHGPYGMLYGNEVYEAAVAFPNISYPFDLSLYLNSTLTAGRDAVYFTGVLHGPGESVNSPFDYVIFNSTRSGGRPLQAPAVFSANGTGYDPYNLTNDFELDFGGPGDGSQATLAAADGTLGLGYWDPTADGGAGGFVSVPSAFNYGGETGETSSGATVTWSDTAGGPAGFSTYGTMATGPSFLEGLWNASGPEGSYPVTIDSSPVNAFQVVTPSVKTPWTDLSMVPAFAPSLRSDYQEAYDPGLDATILFGGWSPITGVLGDTWEFTYGQWYELSVAGGPRPRFGGSMVYDASDGCLVLFGGKLSGENSTTSPKQFLNDTWIFNATGWHQLHPAHAPSPRGEFAMAYDAADSEVVLFGGGIGTLLTPWVVYSDTWTFHAGKWTNITSTAGTPPPARVGAGVAYDAADGYVLLVDGARNGESGVNPCAFTFPDQWAFSGGHWTELTRSSPAPPAGAGSVWFDTATATTYYYEEEENLTSDGGNCSAVVGDVWSYAAGVWRLLAPGSAPGAPQPRFLATVVDDAFDHLEILFGGQQSLNGTFYNDTWAFDPNITVAPGSQPRVVAEAAVGPTITTDTFWLAPGNYSLETELSGYAPVVTALNVTGPVTVSPALPSAPSLGIYTPLWAWSQPGVAAIASAGGGTPSDPYVLENSQTAPIGATFGLYNDFGFPVYPGVFLLDTQVPTELLDPANFSTATNDFQQPGPQLPQNNSLQYWFWNVSGLAVLDGVEVGVNESVVSPLSPFGLVFYDSSHDLVARSSFGAPAASLLFATGPTADPAFTGPGGNNTVWGNTFGYGGDMGVVEVESGDLIYNNNFSTAYTACQPGDPALPNDCWPIYAFTNVSLSNSWNVSVQPASVTHYALGFPDVPLNGSIIGTSWQGGNFWWNYGAFPNPYGVLPYDENLTYVPFSPVVYITPGGDYAPLTNVTLYAVRFASTGLPLGDAWEVEVTSPVGVVLNERTTSAPVDPIELPNGSYDFTVTPPEGYGATPDGGPFNVSGANVTLSIQIAASIYVVQFSELGLPAHTLAVHGWALELNGTVHKLKTAGLTLSILSGFYPLLLRGPAGYQATLTMLPEGISLNPSGTLEVTGPLDLLVRFVPGRTVTLGFHERGLPTGSRWCVEVDGDSVCAVGPIRFQNLTPFGYAFSVVSPLAGQVVTGKVGRLLVDLTGGRVGSVELNRSTTVGVTFAYPFPVTFTQTGLTGGSWSVTVKGLTKTASYADAISFNLTNGTYSYRLGREAGYRGSGTPPKVIVDGAATSVKVTFTPK